MGHSFRDLIAWQKAKKLAVEVYRCTEDFPKSEVYGLTAQIRRASVSIPSNIAEGQGRATKADFAHFLCVARGSLLEFQTQLEIATELDFLMPAASEQLQRLCKEQLLVLNGLLESLNARAHSASGH